MTASSAETRCHLPAGPHRGPGRAKPRTGSGLIGRIGRAAIVPLLAYLAACIQAKPPPEDPRRIMSADSKVLRSSRIDVGGLSIHYLESTLPVESGMPVILVHGLALSGQYTVPTAEALAPLAKVYVPDFPGFGDSAKLSHALDVPQLADALADWMDAMEMPRAHLVGNSFACQIIAEFAARFPERVDRAVLQGPTTDPDEDSWLMQFIRWQQNSKYNPPKMSEVADIDYDKCGIPRALTTFQYSLDHNIEEVLPHVHVPTLVVRGALDPICRQDWAERATELLPDGRLVVIPGVAHTLVFTSPDELVAAIRPFLGL